MGEGRQGRAIESRELEHQDRRASGGDRGSARAHDAEPCSTALPLHEPRGRAASKATGKATSSL